jgi:hypothetical protein
LDEALELPAEPEVGLIAYLGTELGNTAISRPRWPASGASPYLVDLYRHFIRGADLHHVEGLADALETALRNFDGAGRLGARVRRDVG